MLQDDESKRKRCLGGARHEDKDIIAFWHQSQFGLVLQSGGETQQVVARTPVF